MSLEDDIKTLRELLWLSHGHTGQYGDDGEMQCMQCFHEYGFYDWKRTPVQEIAEKIQTGNLKKFAKLFDKGALCMNLKVDRLSPTRYEYLSQEDSALYDQVKDSTDPKDIIIKKLLLDKAGACRSDHYASTY